MENTKPYQYGSAVKISNWQDRMQSYPLDNPNPHTQGSSHYRTFGDPNFVLVYKTTTQDQFESGTKAKTENRQIAKYQMNFVTYPLNDFRFNHYGLVRIPNYYDKVQTKTTYSEVFKAPRPLLETKDCCEKFLDPLLNRIPKNDFEMLPSSENKFMDDHLVKVDGSRKKINYLRQLRNTSNVFYTENTVQ